MPDGMEKRIGRMSDALLIQYLSFFILHFSFFIFHSSLLSRLCPLCSINAISASITATTP